MEPRSSTTQVSYPSPLLLQLLLLLLQFSPLFLSGRSLQFPLQSQSLFFLHPFSAARTRASGRNSQHRLIISDATAIQGGMINLSAAACLSLSSCLSLSRSCSLFSSRARRASASLRACSSSSAFFLANSSCCRFSSSFRRE